MTLAGSFGGMLARAASALASAFSARVIFCRAAGISRVFLMAAGMARAASMAAKPARAAASAVWACPTAAFAALRAGVSFALGFVSMTAAQAAMAVMPLVAAG